MIVAGLQLDVAWEDPRENFARAESLALPAAQAGARLLVLPEMFATGFSMAAERVSAHAGEIREFLADLARRHGVWVLGGYAEPGAPRPRNACALFDPQGDQALVYHKIHPFSLAHEPEHYAAGEALATQAVEGVRVTPVICYDLRFPEVFRAAADGTDLFLVIASWPSARREAWRLLLRARALENQAFVLGVNRVGDGDGLHYSGDSALLDPMGQERVTAAEQPALVLGDVDPETVATCRRQFSFLADKKFALYTSLYNKESSNDPFRSEKKSMTILFCANAFKSSIETLSRLLPDHTISFCEVGEVEASLDGVEVAIPLMASLNRQIIEKSSLKLIQQYGVGLDGVDLEAASEKGVWVANVPSLNADSTAEQGIFLMMALARRYQETQNSIHRRILGDPAGIGLVGKTVGIVGLGNVGKELVKRLKGFDVSILATKKDPSEQLREELGVDFLGGPEDLPYLLKRSDFVILCLLLTPETRGLIAKEQFRIMKRSAYLINLSRGPIIHYEDFLCALETGEIQGAGLDVFWREPVDPQDPILRHNVIATPHVAGWTDVSALKIGEQVARNIARVERGEAPEHCVNLPRIRRFHP